MSTAIVILNVSQTAAPAPNNLQKKGAFISQGATTLAANASQLLTSATDLTAILAGALAITSITWSGSVATVTTAAPHGIPTSQVVELTITGESPAGYNGTFACTSTGASTFTYPLASNPGSQTMAGVYTPEDVAELVAMNTTFWAQGSQQPVTVLELGDTDTAHGVSNLNTYIGNNTAANGNGPFCRYLLPRTWAAEVTLPAFLNTFNAATAKTYFHITATTANYTNFTNTMKCAKVWVEAPGIPATEFTAAADFYNQLNLSPSATNKVVPNRYDFISGVTPYPLPGNMTIINALLAANVNIALTAAEAQLASAIVRNGTTMDGRDGSYWYSVDWVQINVDANVSAAIVNGSNNPQNPLYYSQDGINRLQAVIASTMAQGVSFGMVLGAPIQTQLDPATFATNITNGVYAVQTPINAQPFIAYTTANPNDFSQGIYNGFAIAFTPNRGFTTVTINLNVTDFVGA